MAITDIIVIIIVIINNNNNNNNNNNILIRIDVHVEIRQLGGSKGGADEFGDSALIVGTAIQWLTVGVRLLKRCDETLEVFEKDLNGIGMDGK